MVDDERLLTLLGGALAPEQASPPAGRIAALRRLAESRSPAASVTPTLVPASLPASAGRRRAAWWASGVAAVAALLVAVLVLPGVVEGGRAPSTSSRRTDAVARVRAALVCRDPIEVVRADADLMRQARELSGEDQERAVAAHVAAVQFLRDHDAPPSDEATEQAPPEDTDTGTDTAAAPGEAPEPAPAEGDPVPAEAEAAPPAPSPRSVTIRGVIPLLDGTFQVDYAVAGFTPDSSGLPCTWSVRFTFDDGQSPTIWAGPSPWSFPVGAALIYRQVCAHVVDAAGIEEPASGECKPIL